PSAAGDTPPPPPPAPGVARHHEQNPALARARHPDERYQAVDQFGRDLAAYLEEMGIEPSNEELHGYFRDPAAYVVKLDARVCETLTLRAREAADEGETARSIRLLGRVLELDADHPGATALLEGVRRRERRNRRLLVVGAAAAMIGLVTAAATLLPPSSDPVAERELVASRQASSLDRAEPSGAAEVADSLAGVADPSTGPSAAAAGSTTASESDETSGSGSGGETDTGAATVSAPDRVRRRPTIVAPPRVPVTTPCRLSFTGIPLPTAQNLSFLVGTKTQSIEDLTMDVELPGTQASVRIKDSRYVASRTVTREQCEAGPVTVEIRAKAAKVKFEGVGEDVVVLCKVGCRSDLNGKNQTVKTFQPVPIEKGRLQQTVRLLLKHADFESTTIEEDLSPGPNVVRVSMIPRK
ncbi:MAG: hypothetical protein AB1Z98_04130, partial [Nannocystaceae bacterium]